MRNPFVYGEICPASAFADRERELDELTGDLAAAQKVFLISPRRFGKSSLIHHALADLERRGLITLQVTVSSFSSYLAFLEGLAQAVLAAEPKPVRAIAWLREHVRTLRPEVRYSPREASEDALGGAPGVTVSFAAARSARDVARLAPEVFDLPERIALARKRTLVVAFDEFQSISAFDGGQVEHTLRAAIQRQRHVGYVFAGSEPALMERMIGPKRPFYKAGPVMRLGRIPAAVFGRFLEARFRATGFLLDDGVADSIVEVASNTPYDVQRLAHETWDEVARGRRTSRVGRRRGTERLVTSDDVHAALRRLLAAHEALFEQSWERLTLQQRAALRAVVFESGVELLADDTRRRHRMGGPSSVQAALAALVREELVAREGPGYVVVDSLFREWVARRTR